MEKTIKATLWEYDINSQDGKVFSKEALDKMVKEWKSKVKDSPSYGELNHPDELNLMVNDIELVDDGVEISYREIPKEQQKCAREEINRRWAASGLISGLTIHIKDELKPLFESFSWSKLKDEGDTELPDKENVPE